MAEFAKISSSNSSQLISAGKYNVGDLLIGNDRLTRVAVPDGWKLTLFEHSNYSGASVVYDASQGPITNADVGAFQGKTSSLILEPSAVTLYLHENYEGTWQILRGPGRYDQAAILIGNDQLTSLRVPEGWKVSLYPNADFSGTPVVFRGDCANVGTFNDRTSSIVIEVEKAIIYEHENFVGRSQVLDVGRYDVGAIKLAVDTISSVRVPAGWTVTLFADSNFSGDSVAYSTDTTFVGNFNDRANSVVVAKNTDWLRPAAGQDYLLTSVWAGLVAEVPNSSTAAGTVLKLATRTGAANQIFRFEPLSDGYFLMRTKHSQLAVQVEGAGTEVGASVTQGPITKARNQQWRFVPHARGQILYVRHTQQALKCSGTVVGSTLFQANLGTNGSQIWTVTPFEDATPPTGTGGTPIPAPGVSDRSGQGPSLGTATGTSTTSSAGSLPAEVQSLDSISVPIFFVPFNLPIAFSGDVTIQPLSKAMSYSGAASLSAPFGGLEVNPLALSLSQTDGWVVKFGLPQSNSIASIIESSVLGSVPSGVKAAIETLVMPYLRIYQNAIIILAKNDGEDEEQGGYLGGFNVYTTLKASQIPPLNLLHDTFPGIGLDTRDVVLGVGSGSAAAQSFFVGAQLNLDVPLVPQVPQLAVLNSLSVNVTKQSTDLTAGAQLAFTLKLAGDVLKFDGGITVANGTSVSLWGALEAEDGAWENPFGFKGITITSLGVEVGITAVFPFLGLGLRGEVHIGNGLLGGRVGILLDASDPSKCILDIYSQEGLNLPKLIKALTGGLIDVSKLLNIALTELQLYVAPTGGTIAGKTYDPGYALGGNLNLWGFNIALLGKLTPSGGGSLMGSMDVVNLSAGGVNFLKITGLDGTSKATVNIECTPAKQEGLIDAQVVILGTLKQGIKLVLNSSGFSAQLTSSMGIYSNASLVMQSGLFKLSYSPGIKASVSIEGYTVSVDVKCTVYVEVNKTSFSQSISFSFSAMGKSFNAGPYGVSVPFSSVTSLLDVFNERVKGTLTSSLLAPIREATEAAFQWVKTNVTADAKRVADFFKGVGADVTNVAKGLVNFCGTSAETAVTYLNLGAEESARILRETFNRSVEQVGDYLHDVRGFSEDATRDALEGAGYAVDEVGDWAEDTFNPSNW